MTLLVIIGLNYLINPYHYFNSGILYDGNFTSFKVFKLPSEDIIMYKLSRDIQKTEADTLIIGSSRVLRGFNTCNQPKILKVPKPGMSLNQTKALLKEALRNEHVKTIYIEASWLGSKTEKIKPIEKPTFWEATLSLNSVVVSINTLLDYYHTKEAYNLPNCYCRLEQNFSDGHEEYYKKLYERLLSKYSINNFVSFIYDIAKECQNSKNVNIRFIVPPMHQDLIDFSSSPFNSKVLRNKISNVKRQFKFIDVISYTDFIEFSPDVNSSLYNKDFWYDKNHFKPMIGDMFLEFMQQPYAITHEEPFKTLNTEALMLLLM